MSRSAAAAILAAVTVLAASIAAPPPCLAADDPAPAKPISFYADVRPILQANCQGCHQPAKAKGDYIMTDFAQLVAGPDPDTPAVVPGNPDASLLVEVITPVGGEAEMPQKDDPLHPTEIATIRRWIAAGAADDTPQSARQKFDADNPPSYSRAPVVSALDFSPDGSLLAVSGFHEVLLHRADGSGLVARLVGLSERIESVAFSPDGTRLAVTGGLPGRMGEVQIWDVAERTLELSVPVTYDTVFGASWSPDGRMVAFGCTDLTVRAVDARTGEQLLYMGSHTDWPVDTVFSVAGDYLVSVGRDMTAKLTKVDEQRFIDNITSITPKALKGGIHSITRHPQRDEVLFGGADGVPKIYRMHRIKAREIGDDSNQLWELPALPGRIFAVAWSDDGQRIAAGSSLDGEGAIKIFRIDPAYQVPGEIDAIIKTPTHKRNADQQRKLRDHFQSGVATTAELRAEAGVYALAFSPDGSRLAAAGGDGTVRIFDAAGEGKLLTEFVAVPLEQPSDAVSAR